MLDPKKDEDKPKIEATKQIEVAMKSLTLVFNTEATMGVVDEIITDEWPDGLACKVV
jgi:hypothetical protein